LDHELPDDNNDEEDALELRRASFVLDLVGEEEEEDDDVVVWSLDKTRAIAKDFTASRNQEPLTKSSEHPPSSQLSLSSLLGVANDTTKEINDKICFWKLFQSPIVSMAHITLANALIEQALCHHAATRLYQRAHHHIQKAVSYWPTNPSALLGAANLERMGKLPNDYKTDPERMQSALDLYLAAAKMAHTTRQLALTLLNNDDLSNDDKYLVESILLSSAKVEPIEETTNDDSHDDNEEGSYGASQFLVTASCVSALLASALGRHETARQVLQRFGTTKSSSPDHKIVTRIHPAVWDAAAALGAKTKHSKDFAPATPTQGVFTPRVFPNTVPDDLFDTLRYAFRPNAPYWEQSGYDRNVYYSFWTDWPLPRPKGSAATTENSYIVSNTVEHYIVAYLLPLIKTISPDHILDAMKGFEWWVHTRPHGANLGHQLHFDTDEALLDQDGQVEFPISASVTYLNADDHEYGATILFDQTPQTNQNATTAWINLPRAKSFLIFPGNLLHGVLPCMTHDNSSNSANGTTINGKADEPKPHRLTFMVNFWSYRIPDRIKKQKLYGPSGPFPPKTRHHSWTHDICGEAYPQTVALPPDPIEPPPTNDDNGLVAVSPAWDHIDNKRQPKAGGAADDGDDDGIAAEWAIDCHELDAPLVFPASGSGINQRFFVTNAPEFFNSTLYEK
jgi:hypothetical protein